MSLLFKKNVCIFIGGLLILEAISMYLNIEEACDVRRLGGCGPLDMGLGQTLDRLIYFIIMVAIATPGCALFKWGITNHPFFEEDQST